jgi:hypothetical protein
MRLFRWVAAAILFGLSLASIGVAQSTAPTTRHALVVPPGFNSITESGINAICLPEDEAWVRQTLAKLQPTTRPSTMPSDLLSRAEASRAAITQQIQADLAVADVAKVNALFDEKLLPMLRRFDELRPPIFYMVATREKIRDLLRGGWEDPRFRYNRASDDVVFNMSVNLSIDGPLDDTVLPVIYKPEDSTEQRSASLADTVGVAQAEIVNVISQRSQFLTQMAFVQFISDEVMKELNLSADQAWLALGLSGVLSTKYASPILGVPQEELIGAMTFEHPRNPVKIATIDLLHPTPASELREQIVPIYLDAMRRKSTLIVRDWLEQAGDGASAKVIARLRQDHPADGAALVKLIQELTSVDLAATLSAK